MENPQLCGRNIKVDVASGEKRTGGGGGDRRGSTTRRGGRGDRGPGERQHSDRGDRGGERERVGDRRGGTGDRDDRGERGPVDGTQFMGGRYSRSNSAMSTGSGAPGGGPGMRRIGSGAAPPRRADSSSSHGGLGGAPATGGDVPNSPARQRPSLKLVPRTKPLENAAGSTTGSSIFGGAKPRDESKFIEKKEPASEKDVGEVTSAMDKVDVKESDKPKEDSTPAVDTAATSNGDAPSSKNDSKTSTDNDKAEKLTESSGQRRNIERKPSRGEGRGRGRDGGERNDRRDGDGGRREGGIQRKPSRGEGRGRGERTRNGERSGGVGGGGGGRNGKEAGRRGSSTTKPAVKDGDADAATSTTPLPLPVAAQSKAPPKKVNSFAAFMDDSDDE